MNTATATIRTSQFLKTALFQAARLPIFYLIIGMILSSLSYVDDFFGLQQWKEVFDWASKLAKVFIVFALVTFAYNLLVAACYKCEKMLLAKHAVAALILSSIRKGLRLIFLLIGINIVILLIGPTQFYLILANNVINTIIIGSIGWIVVQVLYTCEAVLYQYMLTLTNREHTRAKALYTKMHIIRNLATVVIIVITIAAILMSFNSVRNIGISLLASAGFLTAIIGLAAQKTLFSLFSGLQIALSQTIKIGDIVVLDGHSGIIEEVTFTYVTLKLLDRRRLVVPINHFIEKPFENWSRECDGLMSSIYIYVDYMLPIDPLRAEFQKILLASPHWDGKANRLEVSNLKEQCVELRLQVSAVDGDELSFLRCEVREKLLAFIRQEYPDHFPKTRLDEKRSS